MRVLNRVVVRDKYGYTIEADPRHAELAIRDLGLEGARGEDEASERRAGRSEQISNAERRGRQA